jgi:hypothetical protein
MRRRSEEKWGGGVRRNEEKWGGVMTSLIDIRHNYMQWRHSGQFKHDWVKLADYAFFSVLPTCMIQ